MEVLQRLINLHRKNPKGILKRIKIAVISYTDSAQISVRRKSG